MLDLEFVGELVYNLDGFLSWWEIRKKKCSLRFSLIGQPCIKGPSLGFIFGCLDGLLEGSCEFK